MKGEKNMKTRVRKQAEDRFLTGTSIGIVAAVLICILSCAAMAMLVGNQSITEENSTIGAIFVHAVCSFVASVVAGGISVQKKGLASIISVCSYFVILLMITILFFDGAFDNVFSTLIAVLVGYGVSKIPSMRKQKGSTRFRKIKIRK